jgi:hypothetical protein
MPNFSHVVTARVPVSSVILRYNTRKLEKAIGQFLFLLSSTMSDISATFMLASLYSMSGSLV